MAKRREIAIHLAVSVCALGLILPLVFPVRGLQAAYQTLQFDTFTKSTPYWSSLRMDMVVSDAGENRVDFLFQNSSLVASSIANIYFDDGSLLDIDHILHGPGTAFIENPTPTNLPAENLLTPFLPAAKQFSVGAATPPAKSGVNPGEWVMIRFDLITGGSYQSVIDELETGELRVGLHIIGLPFGSESAVNIPEPASLGLLALGSLALIRRKK